MLVWDSEGKNKLADANKRATRSPVDTGEAVRSDLDGGRQLKVDVVSAVLDRNDTAARAAGHNGNRFAAVAAEREEKGIKLLIFRVDLADGVFFSFSCVDQGNTKSPACAVQRIGVAS